MNSPRPRNAMKSLGYRSTIAACYVGNVVQAAVVNLTPLVFIPLRTLYGLSYAQFGTLVLINFVTQVVVDLAFSKAADRYGFRPFAVMAHVLCVLGLLLFAAAPLLFGRHVYVGLVLGTVVFAGSGGLLELLLSPIVDAIPTDSGDRTMSLLHSFYAWGAVLVVVITTSLLALLGIQRWPVAVIFWALPALFNVWLFARVPLTQKVEHTKAMKVRALFKTPAFVLLLLAIICGGAAEVTMSGWASSFMEKGLHLPKFTGDMLGMCGFAVMLGLGRMGYGLLSHKLDISRWMCIGATAAVVCYVATALSPFTALSVAACCLTGLVVSMLWPGALLMASRRLPLAGASMFALLSAGGDTGASLGPWLTGMITDVAEAALPADWAARLGMTTEQLALRAGLLVSTVSPLLCLIILLILLRHEQQTGQPENAPQ